MSALFSGILESLATRADKSIKVTIGTQEASNDLASRLFGMHQRFVKVIVTDKNVTDEIIQQLEELEINAEIKSGKSPATRLRNVLYLNWQQSNQEFSFDSYYETQMERLIEHFKEKLN